MGHRAMTGRLGAAWVLMGLSFVASADEQDSIDYRQHIMKTMQEQTASISMIVAHKAPAENLSAHAKLLVLSAGTAKNSFATKASGGNAEPEIWSNAADFGKRMDALVAAANDLAQAAAGGPQAVATKNQAVLNACKACHDTYVIPKK